MSRTQITALSELSFWKMVKSCTKNNSNKPDYKQAQVGTPDYSDLLLDKYISVIEIVNPCTACGVTADGINSRWRTDAIGNARFVIFRYIKIYEPVAASLLCDRMEQMMEQTGKMVFIM
jgi:hypothetical protein